MKTLVIITSVINISNNPFDYTRTRSVYSSLDRYKQTLKTLESISLIPNSDILFIETSPLETDQENEIKNRVSFYVNFDNNLDIKSIIDGRIKGKAESTQIWEGLKSVNINDYDSIIKLSGRYWLNKDFDYELYSQDINIFRESPSKDSISTVLYKIRKSDFDIYNKTLDFCRSDEGMLESNFLKFFSGKYTTPSKIGVSGYVSIDGNYIEF